MAETWLIIVWVLTTTIWWLYTRYTVRLNWVNRLRCLKVLRDWHWGIELVGYIVFLW
jgi:hypothetical protein